MWITFIGFTAAGKSTAIRQLQLATGRVACDLDTEVARRDGLTIPEIIAREGEVGLRRREHQALEELASAPALLLAASSGTVETPSAVRLLHRRGVVFWLDAPWEVVRWRLENAAARPPVPAGGDWEVERLAYGRYLPLYAAAADFRLRSDRLGPEGVAQTALLRSMAWRRQPRER
jgi:shikimate kinase